MSSDKKTFAEAVAKNIDDLSNQSVLFISIVLGLNQTTTIANDVHYMRTVTLLTMLAIVAFACKVKLDTIETKNWLLVAEAASQITKGVQHFSIILALQIITQRLRILDSEAEHIEFWSRLFLYGIFLLLIITLPILVKWYLFDGNENNTRNRKDE